MRSLPHMASAIAVSVALSAVITGLARAENVSEAIEGVAFPQTHPVWQGDYRSYTVEEGDTVWRIASRYQTSVDRLVAINDSLENAERIFPGQQLLVPLTGVETLEQHDVGDAGSAPSCELIAAFEREGIELPLPTDAELEAETTPETPRRELIYGSRTSEDFVDAVVAVAGRLSMDPDHLMAIIYYETGGSFRPSIRNPYTQAVGLIQFLPCTARALGTTDGQLAAMTRVEQLVWVERYLSSFRGRLSELEDAYMAVLYPAAVGRPLDFVLFRRGTRSYERNPGLDRDDDGVVTKREVGEAVRRVYENGRAELEAEEN